MDKSLTMDLIDLIAKQSMRWDSEERFMFIWNNDLIIGHYDRDRRKVMFLTPMEPEDENEATAWFEREILKDLAAKAEEEEEENLAAEAKEKEDKEDEEDRNRSRRHGRRLHEKGNPSYGKRVRT